MASLERLEQTIESLENGECQLHFKTKRFKVPADNGGPGSTAETTYIHATTGKRSNGEGEEKVVSK